MGSIPIRVEFFMVCIVSTMGLGIALYLLQCWESITTFLGVLKAGDIQCVSGGIA